MFNHLLSFFISSAYAEPATTAQQSSGSLSIMLMFVVFFLFVYFTIWRPQNKRAKEQQNLLGALTKGDEVMTAGGMYGKITKIQENHIILNIANNVEIIMQKSSIVTVLPKGTLKSIE